MGALTSSGPRGDARADLGSTPALAQSFAWLLRLRWAALVGHLLTIVVVDRGFGIRLPVVALCVVVGLEALTNVAAQAWQLRRRRVTSLGLALVMALDVVILTALLYFTGGPFNPFSFLYLVHIALAAVVLQERSTWALVVLALLASALLFVDHVPLPLPSGTHDDHMRIHLQGMWVAFGVAAMFIVWFLMRVLRALARQEAELQLARAQKERLASLATLSAGAAHELATPLSTILVVTRELERRTPDGTAERDDIRLVREQVERCRAILDGMNAQAGELAGEGLVPLDLAELARSAQDGLAATPAVDVSIHAAPGSAAQPGPLRALAQALRVLLKNAQDASGPEASVALELTQDPAGLRAVVRDQGAGITPEDLPHVGEPFFTTKAPGRGMGLGLFLARTVVEQLGGTLSIDSTVGRGTTVDVHLPRMTLRQDATLTRGVVSPHAPSRG